MASKFEAYDGKVVFYTTFNTLESLIVREAIDAAVPEHKEFPSGSQIEAIYANFRSYMSNTADIEFHLDKDDDDDLREFKSFWKTAKGNTNWAEVWKSFRKQTTLDIHNIWDDATDVAIPRRLLANMDLQPSAPDDEELERVGEKNALTPETT